MPLHPRATARLDHVLATTQRDARLPSVVAGVVRDGALVWHGAAGTLDGRADGRPADDDTQYRMGSITKTLVAVCVLRLRDAGRLDLADRLEDHVPGSRLGAATVEQLLTHASGAQAETNGPWWERTPGGDWDALAGAPVDRRFRSGRRFHYSNVGYAALGRLLEVHHGAGWAEVVRTDLLEPLGMSRTTTRPAGCAAQGLAVHPFADVLLREPEHDAGAMAPAGQLWTTVRDLARWATFLGGDTAGLLAPDTLAEMCEPHHVVDDRGQPWTGAHGLGWQVWNLEGVRWAGHGGSMPGFLAGLRVRLEDGDGVVTMTNTTSSTAMQPFAKALLQVLDDEVLRPVTPWSASGDPALLELVGTWHWGAGTTTARTKGEHLVLGDPGTARASRFARTGEDAWVGLDGYLTGEPLTVVRRTDGSVSHLDVASFRFARTPYDPEADVPGGVDELGWH
ncbi:beta-lactamase family protein [Phycicoccus sp. CSK15P-2]|uniref:serine hydrolase domain-containing protein n=1 Tax=Phycicoccus sp. CSK15P-2 TaxID=2807627 RepID=UPI00194F88B8|nr:serine hydrolase domain-containing protein [Phycicoccus sp. CSK15P-2]MBM6404258.1 beta-lactamase family protein [Phycicoccus sp. CSK15P-2]